MRRCARSLSTIAIAVTALAAVACTERTTPMDPSAGADESSPSLAVVGSGDAGGGGAADVVDPDLAAQQFEEPQGSNFECAGTATGVFDNVTVPPGARCVVVDALILGNLKALQGSALLVLRSEIRGNIHADGSMRVQLRDLFVGGDIDLVQIGPDAVFREVAICGAYLPKGNIKVTKVVGGIDVSPVAFCDFFSPNFLDQGNIQIDDNFVYVGRGLRIFFNFVAQNLQVIKTRGPSLVKNVVENTVDQNLQCFENAPPFNGGPNFAQKAEGQCF